MELWAYFQTSIHCLRPGLGEMSDSLRPGLEKQQLFYSTKSNYLLQQFNILSLILPKLKAKHSFKMWLYSSPLL